MSDKRDLLRVTDLTVRFFTDEGTINAVESVNFSVEQGEILGIVGESGAGKSVSMLSLFDLIQNPGRIISGEIWYRDRDLSESIQNDYPDTVDGAYVDILQLPRNYRRALRGTAFGMVFQDPMTSMNPSMTVGKQIAEAVEIQRRARANPRSVRSRTQGYRLTDLISDLVIPSNEFIEAKSYERAIGLLDQVGIPDPEERAEQYPHEFSGGMLQRAMIAQSLAGEPEILIADEPTTTLDVTIQAQILHLLSKLQEETAMSIILVTHDLGVISEVCDRVNVMYAGEIVERNTSPEIFENAVHPYTRGLIQSVPDPNNPKKRLQPIEGSAPDLRDEALRNECYFVDRCPNAMEMCLEKPPEFVVDESSHGDGRAYTPHMARCYLAKHEYDSAQSITTSTGRENT